MNLRIGICDDVKEYRDDLKRFVTEYYKEKNQSVEFFFFSSGEELLSDAIALDLLFLDIEMPGIGGIAAGSKYHERFPHCKISLATAHGDRMPEALDVEPFNFLSKPFSLEKVEVTLNKFNEKYLGGHSIEVFANRISYTFLQKDISLICAINSDCEIYINNTLYRKEISLNKLLDSLDPRLFFQVDRGTVVNISKIEQYSDGIITVDDKTISISRRRKKEFEKMYQLFNFN